ncbi:MAG: hypothetical protein EOM25_00450 [Deltaproteobacteria bacterium]|nr:hypothetical protein [Deltaproteobacteria bacterium]
MGVNGRETMNEERHACPAVVRRACSTRTDAEQAVAELAQGLNGPDLAGVVFFCSPSYDLDRLAQAMEDAFACPVMGCTSAGEIFSPLGYLKDSLVGVGFLSPHISMTPVFIPSLADFVRETDPAILSSSTLADSDRMFALMLVDGLSLLEERLASTVHRHLRGIPLIGGSAGDGLYFQRTLLYHQGRFHDKAASIVLFRTSLPFRTFRIQHLVPTDVKFVITESDPSSRTVFEINGLPAAQEYARIVGVPVEGLCPSIFAANPVVLQIGGQYYVRSILKANDNGSLTFYCAIDNGLVLTLAKGLNLVDNLSRSLAETAREVPDPQLVLGCDCVLRRLELEQTGRFEQARMVLAEYPFVGFSTYGEQFRAVHVNQTLTGVMLGGTDD